MVTKNNLKYWLALIKIPSLSDALIAAILNSFDDLEDFFSLKEADYRMLGLSSPAINYLLQPNWALVDREFNWEALDSRRKIVSLIDEDYPALLREIHYPPPILYVSGNLKLMSQPQLAIVGARNPTVAAAQVAYELAKELAVAGLIITSGLATGIDKAAHQGALSVHTTVAVIGTGINIFYPKDNRQLQEKISDNGAVVTEFSLDTPPLKSNFPRRNRIISGLSMGTLVVEANLKSGSLITARQSLEQGREVFAVPGSIYNPLSRGCHLLIKQGAKLIENTNDILEELLLFKPKIPKAAKILDLNAKGLDADHRKLLECVGYEPTKSDILVVRSNFNVQKVSSILLDLELAGLVCSSVNGYMRIS